MSEASRSSNTPSPGHSGSRMGWRPPTPEELQGQLPQYEIVEVLGMGGMGAVYKGFQTSLERYVAIKIMPPSFTDDDLQYAQRFKQEAKTMARLSHPGIVGVHDCGQTPQGLLFIVMEFIEGTDVHRMIQAQGHLPAEQAMAIIMHVCDALSYAHSNGIIHRDVKPANIMVDNLGRVKVADFGLAKVAAANTGLSSSNLTMGTPDYVAPEALVMGVEVDARADVYSVGVTLYEMLTGKVPRGRFEAASARVRGLDPRFDQVIDHAMRDDREARYASAQALRDDLMRIHTTPLSQSGMRQAAARAKGPIQPQRHPVHDDVPEEEAPSGPPVALIMVGLLVVVGIALFFWKPWAAKESAAGAPVAQSETSPATEPSAKESTSASPTATPVAEAASNKSTASPAEPPKENKPKESSPRPSPVPAPVVSVQPSRSSPTPPAPVPAPAPKSELDLRVANLDQLFHAAAERETEPPFKTNVASLDKGYLGAVDRAMAAATQAGKLDESLALRDEKQRMEREMAMPAVDEAATPEVLKDLRKTYRATYDKLQTDHVKSMQPLYDKYDLALNALQIELTKADKLDDAVRVKSLRERLTRLRSTGATSLTDESGSAVLREENVVIYPNNPTGYKIGLLKAGDQITLSYVSGTWKDHGRLATENPDRPSTNDDGSRSQLVIARAPQGYTPGAALAVVPPGTKTQPFTFTVSASEDVVLRIKENSDNKGNPGAVTYRLKVTRAGSAASGSGASATAGAVSGAAPIPARVSPPGPTYTNSLGMKFVPVPGTQILMCIHETRRRDYAAFAAENPAGDGTWKNPSPNGESIGLRDDDPVMSVSWNDARAFCAWLSKKEGRACRLPTDHEWSLAVGIGGQEDSSATPESLNHGIADVYPWGTQWPPPQGAGNYADRSFKEKYPASVLKDLNDYTDGYATTAPVMSFAPNKLGIYDLGGNAWEWCEDWFNARHEERVLRGASWVDSKRESLFSSRRYNARPDLHSKYNGFRCIVAADGQSSAASTPSTPAAQPSSTPTPSSPGLPFTNSLGMKFVPVPGTPILMCIHETRKKDYAAYAAQNSGVDGSWKNPRDHSIAVSPVDDHPVVAVNWDDAKGFCEWLSKKENRTYRLPTDHEWSVAAGIGDKEDAAATPESLNSKIRDVYPWGSAWPPPKGVANLADSSFKAEFKDEPSIEGYTDGYATTSPVMSFPPNSLGIYDLSGNVWEWCEDFYNATQSGHVLRGGSWWVEDRNRLLTSFRSRNGPGIRYSHGGFRVVVVAAP